MRGVQTSKETIQKIKKLRSYGHSIVEIANKVHKSKSIISKYIQEVKILPKYRKVLIQKQGGSKTRSQINWNNAKIKAKKLIGSISSREKMIIIASLYWGEGTKKELNVINSDPSMLRVFVSGFRDMGIKDSDMKATIRIYSDINKHEAIKFWSKAIDLPSTCFKNINLLEGKKKGKLPYGMCRLRVKKGDRYFKLIISMINLIKLSI
ncbi:MAG: hypothetical protein AAB438_03210 [Patescibacteria group bacterium]